MDQLTGSCKIKNKFQPFKYNINFFFFSKLQKKKMAFLHFTSVVQAVV